MLAARLVGDNFQLMVRSLSLAKVIAAAMVCLAVVVILSSGAFAHPGHATTTAAPGASGLAVVDPHSRDAEGRTQPDFETAAFLPARTGGKAANQSDCIRSCCAGGTACAGAFALAILDADLAPPLTPGAPCFHRASGGEGITPEAPPRPPRSSL